MTGSPRPPQQFARYLLATVGLQTLLVVALLVFGFLVVDRMVWRKDLTEDQRYTIEAASKRIAAAVRNPLRIKAYFSGNLPPMYEPLERQVFDILDEYVTANPEGNLRVERADPSKSQAVESEARNYGVAVVQLPVVETSSVSLINAYGSIVLLYLDRHSEVINVAARYRAGYEGLSALESEISNKLWQLTNEKPKIGICGQLNGAGRPANPFSPAPQEQPEFQSLRRQLGETCDVETVDLKTTEPDPKAIPALLVVRPKEFSDVEVFRLDQYLMKGGRVLMFVTQGTIDQDPYGGSGFQFRPFSTGLDEWLAHVGLRVPKEFVCHWRNAYPIRVQGKIGPLDAEIPVPFWFWPILSEPGSMDTDNPAVSTIKTIHLFWPHPVDILQDNLGDQRTATVLVRSHANESWRWTDLSRVDRRHLDERADRPRREEVGSSNLAVALDGNFTSFFAERPVPPSLTKPAEKPEGEDGEGCGEEGEGGGEPKPPAPAQGPEVVKATVKPTQLVVVGNALFVSDFVIGGADDSGEAAKAMTLLASSLVDWLARSPDLIALRNKRYADRTLRDKAFDEKIEKIKENEELDEEEFYKALDKEIEDRDANRTWWRWVNVLVPSGVVIICGFLLWILRAARRARRSPLPPPLPPS
ncbi:MAG: Gldg family protein [Planctomycetaceae bacterium]